MSQVLPEEDIELILVCLRVCVDRTHLLDSRLGQARNRHFNEIHILTRFCRTCSSYKATMMPNIVRSVACVDNPVLKAVVSADLKYYSRGLATYDSTEK